MRTATPELCIQLLSQIAAYVASEHASYYDYIFLLLINKKSCVITSPKEVSVNLQENSPVATPTPRETKLTNMEPEMFTPSKQKKKHIIPHLHWKRAAMLKFRGVVNV